MKTTSIVCAVAIALGPTWVGAADDKPNAIERGVTKAGKVVERTGDRGAKATSNGLNTAGKWTGRQVERAGKSVGRAADKTTDWVKKKTE